ncbi:hypothetical protein B0T14DRAFT_245843 [Immersiella caudata]|uniref:Uncharacterized protein n=1 Tax=Immersiella caudata TaxID=314043 RepID=A0AA39WJ94_9PEZI|nr:hypothetical protein B0T14DRAFT_245843 [Immersiella caudata]
MEAAVMKVRGWYLALGKRRRQAQHFCRSGAGAGAGRQCPLHVAPSVFFSRSPVRQLVSGAIPTLPVLLVPSLPPLLSSSPSLQHCSLTRLSGYRIFGRCRCEVAGRRRSQDEVVTDGKIRDQDAGFIVDSQPRSVSRFLPASAILVETPPSPRVPLEPWTSPHGICIWEWPLRRMACNWAWRCGAPKPLNGLAMRPDTLPRHRLDALSPNGLNGSLSLSVRGPQDHGWRTWSPSSRPCAVALSSSPAYSSVAPPTRRAWNYNGPSTRGHAPYLGWMLPSLLGPPNRMRQSTSHRIAGTFPSRH